MIQTASGVQIIQHAGISPFPTPFISAISQQQFPLHNILPQLIPHLPTPIHVNPPAVPFYQTETFILFLQASRIMASVLFFAQLFSMNATWERKMLIHFVALLIIIARIGSVFQVRVPNVVSAFLSSSEGFDCFFSHLVCRNSHLAFIQCPTSLCAAPPLLNSLPPSVQHFTW